jgi:hypothetical protein
MPSMRAVISWWTSSIVKNPSRSASASASSKRRDERGARRLHLLQQADPGGDHLGEVVVSAGRHGLGGEPFELGGQGEASMARS